VSSRALVVFSGGQDSTTCLYWALKNFQEVSAITFDYGQRHSIELECSKKICIDLGIPQKIIEMKFLAQLNSNALTESKIEPEAIGGMNNLPNTFVPGRNILFLTLAASYAIPRGIQHVVMGVCETDYSGYPDCREAFMQKIEEALSLGLDTELKIHRPLMNLSKAQIFALAEQVGGLDVVIEKSHTCYRGERTVKNAWGYGCGACPACELRKAGYEKFSTERNSSVGLIV
jgi:7-cyano-7-deazaguanine synthase